MSGDQKQMIQVIEQRDAEFDLELDEIGDGIKDLAEIAAAQGEEVTRQGQLLNKVGGNIDNNLANMEKVNGRMKETLEEVARSSDKMMVDIMCIVLMIGFGAVIYKFVA